VAKENWIKAGDIIASIGDSGGNTVSGLYFEIRHLGVPLNPLRWCQRLERAKLKV
jgi:septal ring factor EnvC (AmiA/AmiB activator)